MNTYHILNGDCLADELKKTNLNQDFIIFRECLIVGNVDAPNINEFWDLRANFIAGSYETTREMYFEQTVKEFEKLHLLPDCAEVCLWFEDDLFCQVNMWFILSYIVEHPTLNLFRIFPLLVDDKDRWKGFGIALPEQLEQAYGSRVKFCAHDILLGKNLWKAFCSNDQEQLKILSKTNSTCFRYLEEVCQAQLDRLADDGSLGRPHRLIKELIKSGKGDFDEVFYEFSSREGIYGFGDLQVKEMIKYLLADDQK